MVSYNKAIKVANRIVELLTPHCSIIHIAGSIRRQKSEVKDIEIVCLPKKMFTPTDLFGGGVFTPIESFTESVAAMTEKVVKGSTAGRYTQVILKGGMTMDLFLPQEHDYYRQLAIRTGSATYSANVIAYGWKRLGWVGTEDGLRKRSDCTEMKGGKWVCINQHAEKPPHWKSEEEFFQWLLVPYQEPKAREVKELYNNKR